MPRLSVVIPAYNEEDSISAVIDRIFSTRDRLLEVGIAELDCLVVDDASSDRTAECVRRYPHAQLVRHSRNRGYGAAIKTGFSHAPGELLAFLDADGTYPPEHLPQLCAQAVAGADLVVGSRMSGAESRMPVVRRVGNLLFAGLLRAVSGAPISDSASGMRVLRRDALASLYPLPDGLDFTPAMSTRALHENLRLVEVPIPYHERVGHSKLSVLKDGMRFFRSIVWTALTYNPVRIFGGLALLLVLLGMAIGLSAWPSAGEWSFPRLFGALLLVVCGMLLFSTGTLFNYIISLFHRRRIRQGLFGSPMFQRPLERHFGWVGLLAMMGSVVLYAVAVVMDWTASGQAAPWFPPVVSALLALAGLQLVTSWFLSLVLAELSRRETEVRLDLEGSASAPTLAVEVGSRLPVSQP